MTRYWISWYSAVPDYRPLTDPPNRQILGWWCTGQRCADEAWTLCALVEAKSEHAAKAAVLADWPEAAEWRFVEMKDSGFVPGDRFPLNDWMRERMEAKESRP